VFGSTCFEVHDLAFFSAGVLDVVAELIGPINGHFHEFVVELVDGDGPSVHIGVELAAAEAEDLVVHLNIF
jgi:hypothetical protein